MSKANSKVMGMSVLGWGVIATLLVGFSTPAISAESNKKHGDTHGINSTSDDLPIGAGGNLILTLLGTDLSATFEGPVNIKGAMNIGDVLKVCKDDGLVLNGNASIYGDLFVKGVTNALGGIKITDKVSISPDGTAFFAGNVTTGGTLTAKNVTVEKDLQVGGNTVIKGNTTITGTLVVNKYTIDEQNASVLNMLTALLGSCKVGSPLTVGPNKTITCGDTTPVCTAKSENRTVDCSAGSPAISGSGTITQQRDYTCQGSTGTWGAWRNISSNCQDITVPQTPACTDLTTKVICDYYQMNEGGRPDQGGSDYWKGRIASYGNVSDTEKLIRMRQESVLMDGVVHYISTGVPTRAVDPVSGWAVPAPGMLVTPYAWLPPGWAADDRARMYSIYANFAWRAPDAEGLAYWLQRLKDGFPISSVVATFKNACHGPGTC